MNFKIISIITGLAIILVDQASKYLIDKKIPEQGVFLVHNQLWQVKIGSVGNAYLAFGLKLAPIIIILLLIAVLAVLTVLLVSSWKRQERANSVLLGIIIAAALSNIIDRLFLGAVRDFISLNIANFNWPIFNLADAIIVIAAGGLAFINLKNKKI